MPPITGGNLRIGLCHLLQYRFSAVIFKQPDDVIGHLVYHVYCTGANVQHDVIAAQLILMNHSVVSFMKNAAGVGGISV